MTIKYIKMMRTVLVILILLITFVDSYLFSNSLWSLFGFSEVGKGDQFLTQYDFIVIGAGMLQKIINIIVLMVFTKIFGHIYF